MSFLTVEEVAERYRTTPSAIRNQRWRHQAPGVLGIEVGRRVLWSETVLEEWEAAQLPTTNGGGPTEAEPPARSATPSTEEGIENPRSGGVG